MAKILKQILNIDYRNLLPFFFITLLLISAFITKDSYDFYFIADNGREIINNGIPYIDWVSMHNELHIVLQQWIVCIIDWGLYDTFGFTGVYIWVVLLSFLIGVTLFLICLFCSNKNYGLAMLLTLPAHIIVSILYACPRPQLYSLLIVLLTIFIVERYLKYNKTKLLYLLPLFSLLHANIHATFWPLTVGIICFYFVYSTIIRKFDIHFCIITICCLFLGVCNPYGIEALIQPLLTSGYQLYTVIQELGQPSPVKSILFIILPMLILSINVTVNTINKRITKYKLPLLIMFIVSSVAALACYRLTIYSIVVFAIAISSLNDHFDSNKKRVPVINNIFSIGNKLLLGGLSVFIISTIFILNSIYPLKMTEFQDLDKITQIIANDDNSENKTCISTNVIEGQYVHFFTGIHPYIDGRLEVYIDKTNYKKDYSTPFFIAVRKDPNKFIDLTNEYNIDYVIIENNSNFGDVINTKLESDYNCIFVGTSTDSNNKIYKLWKRKI